MKTKKLRIKTFKNAVGKLTVTFKRTKLPHIKVANAHDAAMYLYPFFEKCLDHHEELKAIHLSRASKIISLQNISSGTRHGALLDPFLLVEQCILLRTSSLILAHNHPSGNYEPSKNDLKITNKIKSGLALLDITLLDHIILTREGFYSITDNFFSNFELL